MNRILLALLFLCQTAHALEPEAGAYSWFSPARLDSGLKVLGQSMILPKSRIIERSRILLSTLPPAKFVDSSRGLTPQSVCKIIVLYSLAPLIRDAQSEYTEKYIVPQLEKTLEFYARKYGVRSVKELPLSPQAISLSLELMNTSLQELRPYLTTETQKRTLASWLAAVGRSLSDTQPDLRELVPIFSEQNSEKLLEVLSTSRRTRSLLAVNQVLLEYLQHDHSK